MLYCFAAHCNKVSERRSKRSVCPALSYSTWNFDSSAERNANATKEGTTNRKLADNSRSLVLLVVLLFGLVFIRIQKEKTISFFTGNRLPFYVFT